MNRIDLAGRRAVITGGAQGIGRAIAERFLASGAAVFVWDRNQAATESTAYTVDVTDAERVGEAAATTAEKLGGIDILVANAGITGPNTECWNYPADAWRQVLEINLTGIFLCCRAVVPYMIQQKYGRIVNVASIAGKEGNPNASAYSASKAGVIALTKSLGKELAKYDIALRANDRITHSLHAVENSAREVCGCRRNRIHGRLARLGRKLVHNRRSL